MPPIALLGPQRFHPTVARALDDLGCGGVVAVVSAGWQEREAEVDELAAHVDREVVNLKLYERYESVLTEDRELAAGLRQRQEEIQRLHEIYRLRLGFALDAAHALMLRPGRDVALEDHRRLATLAIRALDRQHVLRVRRVHRAFERGWRPRERLSVRRHREAIVAEVARAGALAIAGGHVAVLVNRLRLFDVLELARDRPIVAWSAGAMALTERLVLFHDSPPQGAGHAELLDHGSGTVPGLVVLPHAAKRLALDDAVRVALMARRFAPSICVTLDPGARIDWNGSSLEARSGTRRLDSGGLVVDMVAA